MRDQHASMVQPALRRPLRQAEMVSRSQIARAIACRLWTGRGRAVADRHGAPFYGFVELQPGPSSDEFFPGTA